MALTLIATAGASDANSYTTVAFADAYFEGRPGAGAWTDASTEEKEQALVGATTRLDSEQYRGSRVSESQALAWPRYGVYIDGVEIGSATVPVAVQRAACEEALALLSDTERYNGTGLDQFTTLSVGPISMGIRGGSTGALAPVSTRLLAPYRFGGPGAFRIIPG